MGKGDSEEIEVARILERLKRGDPALSEASKKTLSFAAEGVAKKGIVHGDTASSKRAQELCDLGASLGLQNGRWCRGLSNVKRH